MTNKTIAKFLLFVILTLAVSFLFSSCALIASDPDLRKGPPRYDDPQIVGTIKSSEVVESSGIAASRCQSDVFWTHNDSGDHAFIYAIDRAGEHLGTWLVPNAENRDWEDITTWKDNRGRCFIYIGDIGDNQLVRPEHFVYRVQEPVVSPEKPRPGRENAPSTLPSEQIRFVYPDGDHDAEALMVHPRSGDIFVVSKNGSGPASVYRLKGNFGNSSEQKAVKVAEISLPSVPNGLVTGGDISPDGRSVVVCDYRQAYEFELPQSSNDFDEIWKQRPLAVNIGKRKTGEAVCYSVDGSEILATSEGRNPPIISVNRLK